MHTHTQRQPLRRILVVAISLLIALSGCGKSGSSDDGSEPAEDGTPAVTTGVSNAEFDRTNFEMYYFKAVMRFLDRPFTSPKELDENRLLNFCARNMVDNGEPLEVITDNNAVPPYTLYSIPQDLFVTYLKRYCNMDSVATGMKPTYTVPTDTIYSQGFISTGEYDISITDKSISATVEQLDNTTHKTLYNLVYTFLRDGANIYLDSMKAVPVATEIQRGFPNEAILPKRLLDAPELTGDTSFSLIYAGITAGNYMLVYDHTANNSATYLGYFNLNTMQPEEFIKLGDKDIWARAMRRYGNLLTLMLDDKISVYDQHFKPIEEIPLPSEIDSTSSFSISPDLSAIAYTTTDGVTLYDRNKKTSTFLFEHPNANPKEVHEGEHYWITGFSNDGSKLICSRYGWEWSLGYRIYDLASKTYVDVGKNPQGYFVDFDRNEIVLAEATNDGSENASAGSDVTVYSIKDGSVVLKRHTTAQIYSEVTVYAGGKIFSPGMVRQVQESNFQTVNIECYDIAADKLTTLPQTLTDLWADYIPYALTADGRLLVHYSTAYDNGYALLNLS